MTLPRAFLFFKKEISLCVRCLDTGKMEKKILDKTRKGVLAGICSEVKELKYELEKSRREKTPSKKG